MICLYLSKKNNNNNEGSLKNFNTTNIYCMDFDIFISPY